MSVLIASMATQSPLIRPVGSTTVVANTGTIGAVSAAFPEVYPTTFQERFIVNPNAAGSLWVTFFDGVTPAVNGAGSFEIPPGQRWVGSVANEVRVVGTAANMLITAGSR